VLGNRRDVARDLVASNGISDIDAVHTEVLVVGIFRGHISHGVLQFENGGLICGVHSSVEDSTRERAISRTSVVVAIAKLASDSFTDTRFPGACGAVDGNN
jgi:hypothetical protein